MAPFADQDTKNLNKVRPICWSGQISGLFAPGCKHARSGAYRRLCSMFGSPASLPSWTVR